MGGAFVVFEPPKVWNEGYAIYVDVLGMNQFQQTGSPVCAAEPALFGAAPRSLRDSVSVEDLIDHHRARFNALC